MLYAAGGTLGLSYAGRTDSDSALRDAGALVCKVVAECNLEYLKNLLSRQGMIRGLPVGPSAESLNL